jgi:hypothetical protein
MKSPPELLIRLVPLSILGAVALALASRFGSSLLILVGALILGFVFSGVIASIQYARYSLTIDAGEVAMPVNNPLPEIETVLSDSPLTGRLAATEALTRRIIDLPESSLRERGLAALKLVANSKSENQVLVRSAKRAMQAIASGVLPEATRPRTPELGRVTWAGPRNIMLEAALQEQLAACMAPQAEDLLAFAIELAQQNSGQYPPNEEVIKRMVLRCRGKQTLEIQSGEELNVISAEPTIFLKPESLQTKSGRLVFNCWQMLAAGIESKKVGAQFHLANYTGKTESDRLQHAEPQHGARDGGVRHLSSFQIWGTFGRMLSGVN